MKSFIVFAILVLSAMAADKVTVKALVESYCPDCIAYTKNELLHFTMLEDVMAISDLEILPYGKAHIVSRDPPTFECQHGDKECYGNKVELCSLAYYPTKGLDLMNCMQKIRQFDDETIYACAKEQGVEGAPIIECAVGVEGNNLMLYAGDITPKLTRVPSVLVNGQLYSDAESILKYVCDAYEGEKPESCKTNLRYLLVC